MVIIFKNQQQQQLQQLWTKIATIQKRNGKHFKTIGTDWSMLCVNTQL